MKYDKDFVKEQYAQYHQSRRQMNGFSWQLPSIAVLAILLFAGVDEKKYSCGLQIHKFQPLASFFFSLFFLFS